MRHAFVMSVLMLFALGGSALLPGAVTAAREGRKVLLTERFSTPGSLSRWNIDEKGSWRVAGGRLRADMPAEKQQKSFARTGSRGWTDYAVDLDVCGLAGVDKGVALRVNGDEGIGIDLRSGEKQDLVIYRGYTKLGEAPAPNRNGRWYHIRVEARGDQYTVFFNRRRLLHVDGGGGPTSGGIALPAYTGGVGQCVVQYDNVVVTSLGGPEARAAR